MRTPLRSGRFVALAGATLVVALLPDPASGNSARARSPVLPTAVERALTGGLAVLRAPGSAMIRLVRSRFVVGSTSEDVLEAIESCARDPLAYRCNERTFSNELPASEAALPSFYLDRYEVTRGEYQRCVVRGECEPVPGELPASLDDARLPMTLVRAADAEAYCRARGARLPSELEVERAMRGMSGRRFPWGDLYNDELANHGRLGLDPSDDVDGHAGLAPVGSYPAGTTPDGFFDLAGNAAEWTLDAYSERRGTPPDPALSGLRTVRGGHYLNGGAWLRGAARSPYLADSRYPFIGFRCALSAATRGS